MPAAAPTTREHDGGTARNALRRRLRPGCPLRVDRYALLAVALFLCVRAFSLAALTVRAASDGESSRVLLSERWDSLWYVRVAEHGYTYTLHAPDGRSLSSTAFFPLLPWLERGIRAVTGLSLPAAGLLVSAVASALAAWGIHLVVRGTYGERAGVVCVVLWAAVPVGIVQSMAYSESLFTALAAWGLLCVLRERWVAAGILASLAGLTRPVGLAVTAALFLAVRLHHRPGEGSSRDRTRAAVGCLVAPVGAASYILWVGARRGHPLGYLDVQDEWGNGFDGGWAFARFLTGGSVPLAVAALVALLLLAYWPHHMGAKQRQPPPLLAYSALVTLLAVGASGYFGSKPRLLLPAFPLLIPLAVALARRRPALTWTALTVLTTASAVYGAFWLTGSGPP
ncbi:glycosyltransferase family 39 protein [Streptomyces sp. AM 2-1-1]|uniref:glycosyltransferase family 39 protein n=1 Tax=Streptomyces sp. AM 2-1-1 TaxID=3028709 RepID=UPI0023B8D8FC|nr:glycosyltransferase family 39 protein [Streptomyces sp. AM 2-1-1]WEH40924.1 glycosyltransferase family 39 protein [Streptomyces sp. AM 2-1-1]